MFISFAPLPAAIKIQLNESPTDTVTEAGVGFICWFPIRWNYQMNEWNQLSWFFYWFLKLILLHYFISTNLLLFIPFFVIIIVALMSCWGLVFGLLIVIDAGVFVRRPVTFHSRPPHPPGSAIALTIMQFVFLFQPPRHFIYFFILFMYNKWIHIFESSVTLFWLSHIIYAPYLLYCIPAIHYFN